MSVKKLRKPDQILVALRGFFDQILKNSKLLIGLVVALAAIIALVAVLMNRQESRSEVANNALFSAQKALQTEFRAWAESVKPAEKPADPKAAAPKTNPEDLLYTKTDVDAKFATSVKKFTEVSEQFVGTRAAFEAQVALGALYLDHGQAAKATPWFEKAVASAPNGAEKAASLASLGYTYENQGKWTEALAAFEKALNQGEAAWKGDVLLAMARSQEALKDTAKARSTYDQILSQLPNTEFAKTAESRKALLK